MASVDECEAALHDLAARVRSVDAKTREQHALDRTVSLWVSDLKETFTARAGATGLTDIVRGAQEPDAQVRLKVSSDDLLALIRGDLGFAAAWATGRMKVDASIADLLRLRSVL